MKKSFINPEINISLFNQEISTDATVPVASVPTPAITNMEAAQNSIIRRVTPGTVENQKTIQIITFK